MDTRVLLQKGRKLFQVLVKWAGLPHTEATWENQEEQQGNFPNFNLEDKVNFNGGGNVMIEGQRNIPITNAHVEKGHLSHDPNYQEREFLTENTVQTVK
jgi:hypothetical protein